MGTVNPFPERRGGLPIVDQQGKRVGTFYETRKPGDWIRITKKAMGCLESYRGHVFAVVEWVPWTQEDGSTIPIPALRVPSIPGTIVAWPSEWEPA